jgi:hypothetical protein
MCIPWERPEEGRNMLLFNILIVDYGIVHFGVLSYIIIN